MDINSSFPTKYMKADVDIPEDGDLTVTMDYVQIETLGQEGDSDDKPILYFADHPKGLALNVTNARTIAGMYGSETDNWAGKKIALFATEVDFKGKQTLAIRVRMRKPQALTAQDARNADARRPQQTRAAVAAGGGQDEGPDPFLDD